MGRGKSVRRSWTGGWRRKPRKSSEVFVRCLNELYTNVGRHLRRNVGVRGALMLTPVMEQVIAEDEVVGGWTGFFYRDTCWLARVCFVRGAPRGLFLFSKVQNVHLRGVGKVDQPLSEGQETRGSWLPPLPPRRFLKSVALALFREVFVELNSPPNGLFVRPPSFGNVEATQVVQSLGRSRCSLPTERRHRSTQALLNAQNTCKLTLSKPVFPFLRKT